MVFAVVQENKRYKCNGANIHLYISIVQLHKVNYDLQTSKIDVQDYKLEGFYENNVIVKAGTYKYYFIYKLCETLTFRYNCLLFILLNFLRNLKGNAFLNYLQEIISKSFQLPTLSQNPLKTTNWTVISIFRIKFSKSELKIAEFLLIFETNRELIIINLLIRLADCG